MRAKKRTFVIKIIEEQTEAKDETQDRDTVGETREDFRDAIQKCHTLGTRVAVLVNLQPVSMKYDYQCHILKPTCSLYNQVWTERGK